jgi:hypothetical protein
VTCFYVWYRLATDPADARAAIDALQRSVARRTGVRGRVLARRDDRGITWMETYEDVRDADAFEAALDAAAVETGAHALADGGRHAERFDELPFD